MTIVPLAQWFFFIVFAVIGITGALGMATTMSMFRSGIFLMASFIGVAGLFVLLSADLLGLLQIMMYVGGMLVMILFMVLFSNDPGGAVMADMEMSPIERFFTLGISSDEMGGDGHHQMNGEGEEENGDEESHDEQDGGHDGHDGGMDMADMSMTTPIKPVAAVLAGLVGVLLVGLLLARPAWPIAGTSPDPRSAQMVGSLLMGKYMIAFEGAGLLILIGIYGAVLVSRPGSHPDKGDRERPVAVDEAPPQVETDSLEPLVARRDGGRPVGVEEAHEDSER